MLADGARVMARYVLGSLGSYGYGSKRDTPSACEHKMAEGLLSHDATKPELGRKTSVRLDFCVHAA